MGQMNWLSWCRFLLYQPLTDWEFRFVTNLMRRAYPTLGQRQKLREILHSVYPAGCGKWGMPNE